jgi:hypothetical protein
MATADNPKEDGDHTRKVKIAVHDTLRDELRTVKRVWGILGIVATILGAGFLAAMYLNRYASADSVEKAVAKQDETAKALSKHVTDEAARQSAIEAQGKNIEADYHWQRDQLMEVVKSVHAKPVPPPEHDPPRPPLR